MSLSTIKKLFRLVVVLLLFIANNTFAQTQMNWQAKWIQIGFKEDSISRPAQYFRKSFLINNKLKSAKIYITCRGLYEAQLNGKRIGKAYLTPGWTDYNKRIQYQQYDVTDLMHNGGNVIDVILGDGWY